MCMYDAIDMAHVAIDVSVGLGIARWREIAFENFSIKVTDDHLRSFELFIHDATWLDHE